MIAVRDRLRRWSLRDGRAARPPEGARNAQSGAGAGTTAQARSFEWLLASIPAPRACWREGLERQRSLAQGHSPRGTGGDLIAREQHRSTDQRHDPQSPRWQTHDEPNANHDGDKPAKQDPIDSLTNDSTSRGRFELRVRCRAAHHAVAAAATSFGLAMSPWSAARPTHRDSSDLVASKAMPRIPTACRAGDDQPHRLHPPCTEWSGVPRVWWSRVAGL
jgi:hypothetical protein